LHKKIHGTDMYMNAVNHCMSVQLCIIGIAQISLGSSRHRSTCSTCRVVSRHDEPSGIWLM